MKKRVVILALAAIMICGAIFTGCSTQTEKEESESKETSDNRFSENRSEDDFSPGEKNSASFC